MSRGLRALVVLAALGSTGCRYVVRIESDPVGATLNFPDGRRVVTPDEVVFQVAPFKRHPVTIEAEGHRSLETDLSRIGVSFSNASRRWLRPLRDDVRDVIHLVMVPEHGPSGTWVEEDVPR